MSTPDGAQKEGRSGAGILIFDIDNDHKFIRRIDIPIFQEGIRGFTGNLKTHCVYYSTTNRRLGCFDLEKEEKVWEQTYIDHPLPRTVKSCMSPPVGGMPERTAEFWWSTQPLGNLSNESM